MKSKTRLIIFILIFSLILPQLALAANNPCVATVGGQPNGDASLGKCITQVYQWALALSAILAMLMMVMGGYLVMTSGGNAEQSEKGKGYVLSAIVGMGLLFGTYLILNTINPDLVKFPEIKTTP